MDPMPSGRGNQRKGAKTPSRTTQAESLPAECDQSSEHPIPQDSQNNLTQEGPATQPREKLDGAGARRTRRLRPVHGVGAASEYRNEERTNQAVARSVLPRSALEPGRGYRRGTSVALEMPRTAWVAASPSARVRSARATMPTMRLSRLRTGRRRTCWFDMKRGARRTALS